MTHSSNSTITCIFHLPENSIKQMQIREGIWKPLKSGFSYTIQWVALGKKENNQIKLKGMEDKDGSGGETTQRTRRTKEIKRSRIS